MKTTLSYTVMVLTVMDKMNDERVTTDRVCDWFDTKEEAEDYALNIIHLLKTDMDGIYINRQGTAYFGIAAR